MNYTTLNNGVQMPTIGFGVFQIRDATTTQRVVEEEVRTVAEISIAEISKNKKVTREQIAVKAGVSKKTVEREIKKMGNVHYVGRGYSGHWTID